MALSFEDSLKAAQAESEAAAAVAAVPAVAEDASVMTLDYGVAADEGEMIAAYSGDDGSWLQVDWHGYKFYDEYSDDNLSKIDGEKYIKLDPKQFNITQETNSQYIPFEMSRYYDGFDLTTAKLQIYFVNEYNTGGINYPVNVYYNDEKIRFGWLVDSTATQVAGKLDFEIQATGYNSKGERYIWKSRINKDLNVLQALEASAFVQPDDQWQEDFMTLINGRVTVAEQAAKDAQASAQEALTQAQAAAASAQEAKDAVENAAAEFDAEIETVVAEKVSEQMAGYATEDYVADALLDYYTKDEADAKIQEVVDAIPEVDFTGYATETYVDEAIAAADISSKFENYYTKDEVDSAIENVDVSEQLGELGTNEDGTDRTVVQYVDAAVASVDVSDQLGNLGTNADGSNRTVVQYVQNELANLELDDYTTLEVHNAAVDSINQDITELNTILDGIDKSPRANYVTTYNEAYTFNDVEYTGENALVLYEILNKDKENETRSVVSAHIITGGSGGTSSSNILKIERVTGANTAFTVDDDVVIVFDLTATESDGSSLGSAIATWKLGSKTIVSKEAINVDETGTTRHSVNLTEYFSAGNDQKLTLIVTDDIGTITQKNWYISVVDVRLDSTFSDEKTYTAGQSIGFTYTPYGGVDKTIHFVLDGDVDNEVTQDSLKAAAGRQTTYTIPAQSHGSHLFDAYLTAVINGKTIESNHITKDFIWYDANETTPVIGCAQQEFTARQYETTKITYSVYDPLSETPEVLLSATYVDENGEIVEEHSSTLTMTSNTGYWQYRSDIVGEHTLTITCRGTVKTLVATIEELDIDVEPVTASLAFDFNPVGYSNDDSNRLWSYESETEGSTIAMTVSDNFDWINGGYQIDSNGDSYFCVKAGTTATINYKMFCSTYNIKNIGGHYKLVFKTTRVQDASQPFMQCYNNNVGVVMQPQEANLYAGSGNQLYLAYSEDDIIEFELNMGEAINDTAKMVMGYEDGVATKPLVYSDGATFVQGVSDEDADYITLGSTSCDLHIYRFKAYRRALSSTEILDNFILDTRNATEMISRYDRNQIYKEQVLDPENLAKVCKDLRIIMISAPRFTKDKSDKVKDTTIQCIYKGGRDVEDNWIAYNCQHSGQGTSSNLYGAAGRNLDLIMNKKNDDTNSENYNKYPWIEFGDLSGDGYALGDGSEKVVKVNLTETSVPVGYLNVKVNIASSENANNALLANRYNKFNPYKRPFVREEGYPYNVKDTMEFQNCVIFVRETDETQDANGNYINHTEFNDTDWHFYAIGNIGDSKKTDDTRMNDPDDVNEFVIEVMDNNLPNSKFQSGVEDEKEYSVTGAEIEALWQTYKDNTFEVESGDKYTAVTNSIYLVDENLPIFYELVDGEYVLTSDESISTDKTYYEINYPNTAYSGLYKDKYYKNSEGEIELESGWGISFECRYEHDDGDHDEHRRIWNEFYEFVIFSSDEEFYANLKNYCVLDSVMFYYLFTLRYTMIDNRAKNSFWHYGKCEDGVYRFDLTMDYDNDTALGIDNFGKQVYRYGYEDIDYVDSNLEDANATSRTWVFNAATSTFYKRLRDLFGAELKTLYNNIDGAGSCWSAEDLILQWDNSQSQFPEELWRLDIQRKYVRTYSGSYINGAADQSFLKEKLNGRKKYHRRQFERNQEMYMASKFRTTTATQDNVIRMRAKKPSGTLVVPADFDITITPYSYMYVSVDYGNGVITLQERGEPNVPIKLDYPLTNGDIISIESAKNIKSIGDISPLYIEEGVFSNAVRLKDLILGNATTGYSNTALTNINMVENGLLETLNIENIPTLDDDLNVSSLTGLKTIKAKGSGIQGLILAKNGAVETISLPSSLGVLSMKNLSYLKDIDVDSFDNLTRLTIEDCDFYTVDNFVIGDVKYESKNTIIKETEYHTPNEITIIENAPNLQRVRLTGIHWNLPNTDLLERLYSSSIGGYDANGNEITRSVLAGHVYVSDIKESEYKKYKELWPNLDIQYGGWTSQYEVIFVNYDGSELETQWVDAACYPTDPVNRIDSSISAPSKESTISTDFIYAGWSTNGSVDAIVDVTKIPIRQTTVYKAAYNESTRMYTVKYIMNIEEEVLLDSKTAPYGSNVAYSGETPVYTSGEVLGREHFYLFSHWDKSGFVSGDKTITAVFDDCEYTEGYFEGKELENMRPVEVYALTRLVEMGVLSIVDKEDEYQNKYRTISGTDIQDGDGYSFKMGYDVNYGEFETDVETKLVIDEQTKFTGSNYYETDIKLFEEDRDFVMAIDYELSSSSSSNTVLMQCFDSFNNDGLKLVYNGGAKLFWGDSSVDVADTDCREMLVIRHLKGSNEITVYNSNLESASITYDNLTSVRNPVMNSNLIFGCDGYHEANSVGSVNWCKIWYTDLGEETCKKLAGWTHEEINLQVCGFNRYFLSDGSGSRCTFSLLATHLLDRPRAYCTSSNGVGWADEKCTLNTFLNTRFYDAIPEQIRSLLKEVSVRSSIGQKSTEVSSSDCYITIPALIEVDSSVTNTDPYPREINAISSNKTISYMYDNDDRKRAYADGAYGSYWLRSPNASSTWMWSIQEDGKPYGYTTAGSDVLKGVLIEISF